MCCTWVNVLNFLRFGKAYTSTLSQDAEYTCFCSPELLSVKLNFHYTAHYLILVNFKAVGIITFYLRGFSPWWKCTEKSFESWHSVNNFMCVNVRCMCTLWKNILGRVVCPVSLQSYDGVIFLFIPFCLLPSHHHGHLRHCHLDKMIWHCSALPHTTQSLRRH